MLTVLLSLFLFGLLPVEVAHGSLIPLDVALSDVGVDLVHGPGVRPAADLHGDSLRHMQMVGQTGEAVVQAVHPGIGATPQTLSFFIEAKTKLLSEIGRFCSCLSIVSRRLVKSTQSQASPNASPSRTL